MAHEKKLLVDVFQAYFYRKDADGNRKLVFMSENLTSGGIVSAQENTDVRNGQGNGLFAILPGQKDVTVNLTENVFSFEALELNSAATKTTGGDNAITGLIVKRPNKYGNMTVTAGQDVAGTQNLTKIKLPKVPQNPKELIVSIDGVEFTYTSTLGELAGNDKFTIVNSTNVEAGTSAHNADVFIAIADAKATNLQTTKTLKVMPYIYKTDNTKTQTLTIDAKTFAEGGELWLQTIEKDAKQKATAYVYFVFENAMPEGNFEINTVSEVQPNDMTINMRVLPNEDGELYRIIREEITQ